MKSSLLSYRKLALIAIAAGVLGGVILHFAFPPKWTHINFEVDLKSPDDLTVSLVLTQPGRPDTTLGTYEGYQSIQFRDVRVLRADRDGIILKAVPASDQAEATPDAQLDPRNKTLEFVMEWHDISRVYQILVRDSKTAAGVPDAKVWTSPDSSLARGRTDPAGNAILTVKAKPGTRFYFYAGQADYADGNAEAINQQQGDMATVQIQLAPRPGGTGQPSGGGSQPSAQMGIKVLAVYEGTEESIPGARVSTVPTELSQATTTNQAGVADMQIQGAADRQFTVKATFGGATKASDPFVLRDGDSQSLTFSFTKIPMVEADYFVLVNAGDGVDPSGIPVTANPGGLSATTDNSGRASFQAIQLKQGSTITFSAARGTVKKTANITHKPGGATISFDLGDRRPTIVYTFKARCAPGANLEGVTISVKDRVTNLVYGKGMTGQDGEVQIAATVPTGAKLEYKATAPSTNGVTWSGSKQLSASLPATAPATPIDVAFACAIDQPAPDANTDCTAGDALNRISCLHGMRKFDAALKVEIDKLGGEKLNEAHLYRGYCFDGVGQSKKAVQEFQAVIAGNSSRAGLAYLEIGTILMGEGDWAKAIDQFESALSLNLSDENKGVLFYNYGTCRYMQSRFSAKPRALLAAALEKLNLAQDYLCNEKMSNRYVEMCQEIAADLEDIKNRQSK